MHRGPRALPALLLHARAAASRAFGRKPPRLAPARRRPGFYLSLALHVGALAFAGYATPDPDGDRPTNRNQAGRYWFNRKFKYRKTDANPAVVAAALPGLLEARAACLRDPPPRSERRVV